MQLIRKLLLKAFLLMLIIQLEINSLNINNKFFTSSSLEKKNEKCKLVKLKFFIFCVIFSENK